MQTCRQFVSDIQGELNSLNLDDRISSRLILSKAKDKAALFIKQDSDSRRLFKIQDVWRRLPCVELCPATLSECSFHIPGTTQLMKSRKAIPDAYQTTFGSLVKVLTIDGSKEIKQTTLDKYKDIKNREYRDPSVLYWFAVEDYIYIPDQEIEEVTVWELAKDYDQVDKFLGLNSCLPTLDQPFPCPDYLLDPIKKDLVVELAKLFKASVPDEKPNQNNLEKR